MYTTHHLRSKIFCSSNFRVFNSERYQLLCSHQETNGTLFCGAAAMSKDLTCDVCGPSRVAPDENCGFIACYCHIYHLYFTACSSRLTLYFVHCTLYQLRCSDYFIMSYLQCTVCRVRAALWFNLFFLRCAVCMFSLAAFVGNVSLLVLIVVSCADKYSVLQFCSQELRIFVCIVYYVPCTKFSTVCVVIAL